MKRITLFFSLTIVSLIVVWAITSAFRRTTPLTKEKAIELAEQFIIDNGYTKQDANKLKLSYELFDGDKKNIDDILKHRYNTLHPKAFCIGESKESWDIGFMSTSVDLNNLDEKQRQENLSGRAVIVKKNGSEIRIAHKDPLFSHFTKL